MRVTFKNKAKILLIQEEPVVAELSQALSSYEVVTATTIHQAEGKLAETGLVPSLVEIFGDPLQD